MAQLQIGTFRQRRGNHNLPPFSLFPLFPRKNLPCFSLPLPLITAKGVRMTVVGNL